MSVIVTDKGFAEDDWSGEFIALEALTDDVSGVSVDVTNDTDVKQIQDKLFAFGLIRIHFPSFADGRGFTLARQLRDLGYTGRLRARGHVLADQYAMARRCGYDEIEIDDSRALRQPESQWMFRADWQANDYQSRLRKRVRL